MSGTGVTEEDVLTAIRELLADGKTPSVLDILSKIMGKPYTPMPPATYANDLPFASTTNLVEVLARNGRLTVSGSGSDLRITGLGPHA
jgi:hypothetical protein